MLSSVSHDLKTPLASIIGSLEIYERLKDKLPVESQQTLLTTALQEAYRLDNFITNILDMAKLESGLVRVQPHLCDMESTLEDCVIRLGHRLRDSKVTITALSGKFEINVDSTLLSRAVCLLLDNAVKYGGKNPVIKVEYGKKDDQAFIHVYDSGPGISDSHLTTIFSKYTRFAKQDHQTAGTGLGLAICREIMRLIGGNVEAKNSPAGGAVFELTLPLA
jgi:two-component system sensor histidine kinase KdpD